MNVSAKELRIQPGRIIDHVINGEEVTVTFRGKALARIIPVRSETVDSDNSDDSIFGMWDTSAHQENVEDLVRDMRQGRSF